MDTKAVGSKWTNAVAISTPVPKCLLRNRNLWGIGRLGKRRAMIGKEHAGRLSVPIQYRPFDALTESA